MFFFVISQRISAIKENLLTDHQRDSFKNSYSGGFYLLERRINTASVSEIA